MSDIAESMSFKLVLLLRYYGYSIYHIRFYFELN